MLGILIASHGDMAKGLLNSAEMFFGQDIENIDTISLYLDTPIDTFKDELDAKINKLDTGDGVLILADLFGGTPCNQCTIHGNDRIHVISGANLTMLLEVLGLRATGSINFDELTEVGKLGIIHTNNLNNTSTQDDDFF